MTGGKKTWFILLIGFGLLLGGHCSFDQSAIAQQNEPIRIKNSYEQTEKVGHQKKKVLGIVLYQGFELLDVFGPAELWCMDRDLKVIFVSEKGGKVVSSQGPATFAKYSFKNCPDLDILMIPGGIGTIKQMKNENLLNFLKRKHKMAEFTTSVCTGSWLLAQAGILEGRKATSNKRYFKMAKTQGKNINWIQKARWVEDRNIITSSGVSAGMDMALRLIEKIHGSKRAENVAEMAEYIWNRNPDNDPFAVRKN